MLQIRLSNKAAAAEGGGAAKLASGETVTVACPDHLVLAELPVAKSLGSASGVTLVKTVGRRSRRPLGERVHFCVQCDSPIAIYGRLIPCEHAFCLDCARSDSICYLCDERIQKIQTIKMMEGIFVCAAPHCLKSFLKKSDFESHVHTIHADLVNSNTQKDVNESEAVSAKKPTTSDSTVQAPPPRPVFSPGANSQVQDREDRSQRPQPPLRPLAPPKPTPPQTENNRPPGFDGSNRPPGFDGPSSMNRFPQQNFEAAAGQQQGIIPETPYADYPMNVLQPPNFAVPVNSNLVMGPAPYGQPLYVGSSAPEAGMEQASLLGFPRPWTMGPTGVPFDPSMMANQGAVDQGRVGFYQGVPPTNMVQGMGNAKDVRDGKGILAAPQPLPPPPPPPPQFAQVRGNFFSGDASHDGQGYGWQQDKRDSFGNGQE